jgi:hypothetical protein
VELFYTLLALKANLLVDLYIISYSQLYCCPHTEATLSIPAAPAPAGRFPVITFVRSEKAFHHFTGRVIGIVDYFSDHDTSFTKAAFIIHYGVKFCSGPALHHNFSKAMLNN